MIERPKLDQPDLDRRLSAIENASEIKLYLIIDGIGTTRWALNHDMADGRIPRENWAAIDKDLLDAAKVQQFAVGQLTRFGIEPFQEDGKSPSEGYWTWFRTWDNYIKNQLSESEWRELDRKLSADEDVSMYRPKQEV